MKKWENATGNGVESEDARKLVGENPQSKEAVDKWFERFAEVDVSKLSESQQRTLMDKANAISDNDSLVAREFKDGMRDVVNWMDGAREAQGRLLERVLGIPYEPNKPHGVLDGGSRG